MAEDENKDKDLNEGGDEGGDEGAGAGAGSEGAGTGPKDKKDKKPAKKVVEVDAEVLQKLVGGYEKLQEQVKDLTQAADLGRLSRIQQARNAGKLVKAAKISVYEGKVVLGWARVKDDVFFDEGGRLHEDQQVELYLDSGDIKKPTKTEPMSYRQFARVTQKVEGEVIGETKDKEGQMSYTVQLEDGREFTLPIVFLN